jgi:hypothetical protein
VSHPLAEAGDGSVGGARRRRLQGDSRVALGDHIGVRGIEQGKGPADGERRSDRSDHDGDLLTLGGGSDQKSRLQVLAGGAGVARRNRDHAGDRDGTDPMVDAGPPDQEEYRGRSDQCGDRHSGDRVGAHADLAGDAGRDDNEEEAKDDDENGAQQIDGELRNHCQSQRQHHGTH